MKFEFQVGVVNYPTAGRTSCSSSHSEFNVKILESL